MDQPEVAAPTAAMEDNDTAQTFEPVESTDREFVGDKQRLEEGTLSGSSLSEIANVLVLDVPEHPPPAKGIPRLQRGTEVDDNGDVVTTTSSSGSGSWFDADVEDTDYTISLASSADLIEAYDNALEALQLGNQRERNTFLWIDKCLEKVGCASCDLRNFATDVLRTTGIGSIDVQWTISKGGTAPPRDDIYKRRFLALHEYLLYAYQDLSVKGNVKMLESQPNTGETEGSSESMGEDMWSVAVKQGYPDKRGETQSSGDDGEVVAQEEELKAKFRTLNVGTGKGVQTVKPDESAAGDKLDGVTTQKEETPEDVANSTGRNASESLTIGTGAEKSGDETICDESDAVEGHHPLTASSSSTGSGASTSEPQEVTVQSKPRTTDEARKRAQLIRKLIMRQREALSRMYATAQTRVYRLNSVCQFLLTCVNCATCVCKSAVNAHGLARLALNIAEASGRPDIVNPVREAAIAAAHDTDMAVSTCEKAVQLHMAAVRILEECRLPLEEVRDDDRLGEHVFGEIDREAEHLNKLVDGAGVSLDELARKLSAMESAINMLSHAVKRGKNANLMTKHLVQQFDAATFQAQVVSAVFGTSQLTISVMTSATDALRPLHRLGTGARTPGRSCQENSSHKASPVGNGNNDVRNL